MGRIFHHSISWLRIYDCSQELIFGPFVCRAFSLSVSQAVQFLFIYLFIHFVGYLCTARKVCSSLR